MPTPAAAQAEYGTGNRWVVAPEARCSPYDSDNCRYSQSVEHRIIHQLGDIYGTYTGRWFRSNGEHAVDHIVARSEANDNGLSRVDRATRRRFPEDLPNLTLTAASMNRHRKRDHANDDGVICEER